MNTSEQQFLDDLDDKLWKAADKLRSNLDAANYKPVEFKTQFPESNCPEAEIKKNLAGLGYEL